MGIKKISTTENELNAFYEHLINTYTELINKVDFNKVDKATKEELNSVIKTVPTKQLIGKQKSVSRSRLKKLFTALVLATPFALAGIYGSGAVVNGKFFRVCWFYDRVGKICDFVILRGQC